MREIITYLDTISRHWLTIFFVILFIGAMLMRHKTRPWKEEE